MTNPNYLRQQAKRCRILSKTAIQPEVIEQLRVWEVDFAEEAELAEWCAAEKEETSFRSTLAPRRESGQVDV
jgi:hypothetical protein